MWEVLSIEKTVDDLLYDSTKYALNNEWDLFKAYDSKASTLLTASATLLSIYVGIQIFVFGNIIKIPQIYSNLTDYVLLILIIILIGIIAFVIGCLIISIWGAINSLKEVNFRRAPDPVELKKTFLLKTELETEIAITKSMMKAWSKNHDFINLNKANCIIKSFKFLRWGIVGLIFSLLLSWILSWIPTVLE